MSPRAAALWVAAAAAVALASTNPIYRALIALIALNVLLRHRLPGRRLRPLMIGVCSSGVVAVTLNMLLAHSGVHVFGTIPEWVPGLGGAVTLESVAFGSVTALGIAAAVLGFAALSLLAEPEDIVDALPPALERTGIAVGAALALVPALGRSFRSVREAQLMRGWRPRGPRSWSDLMVPVVLTAVEDSVSVAEAMEARGFGGGMRTRYHRAAWSAGDSVVSASALLAVAAVVAARASGRLADWYPYPTLTVPPADPLVVAACLLLAAPLLAWRSRS